MNRDLSRRDFIKRSVAAAAATAVGLQVPSSLLAAADPESGWRWDKGVCRFCGVGCGIQIATANKRVVAVKGDPDCAVNRGLLCVKGYANAQIPYGEDRLTKPMIRTNSSLKEATWDDALDLVASKYKEALEQHGPRSVAMYGSGQWTVTDDYAALK